MKTQSKRMQPNAILRKAITKGLASLVRLASRRTSQKTSKYYESIEKMWKKAREIYRKQEPKKSDFSPFLNIVSNMRGQYLNLVWTSTIKYGNTERKRVRNLSQGTPGKLNTLLNYVGIQLQNHAIIRYPFPSPTTFEIREYKDGSKKVFKIKGKQDIAKDNAIKVYYKYGYQRRSSGPRVFLIHPSLPGLDFVDMIRTHCIELCRQCFIYDVSIIESQKYINLLIHNLIPFLDYVYTGRTIGRKDFLNGSDRELRKIVKEIRSLYKKRSDVQTHEVRRKEEMIESSVNMVKEKVILQLSSVEEQSTRDALKIILNHIECGNIATRDVEKLVNQITIMNNRDCDEWHRIILSDYSYPYSLEQVVFTGDMMMDSPSPVLIVAKLPIVEKNEVVDFTVFIRRKINQTVVWTPIIIFDLKVKTGFNFNLFGQIRTQQKKKSILPVFHTRKRTLTRKEWQSIISSSPDEDSLTHLNRCEVAILDEYKKIVSFDPNPPSSLWKGVVVIDSVQTPSVVLHSVSHLLEELTRKFLSKINSFDTSSCICFQSEIQDKEPPRVALLLESIEESMEILNEIFPPETLVRDNPFARRVKNGVSLILYILVSAPVPYGYSAARLSTNWHLLHHIQECKEKSKESVEIIWLDLVGDYKTQGLVNKRFGVDILYRERKIQKNKYRKLKETLSDIRFIDLHKHTDTLLTEGKSEIDTLIDTIRIEAFDDEKSNRIIVLDGWIDFKEMLTQHKRKLLRILEQRLLEVFSNSKTEIIWIDDGSPHIRMNKHYQRMCINPLQEGSIRLSHVDEIIYNVPFAPFSLGWRSANQESTRIIMQDIPNLVEPWRVAIRVPQLDGITPKYAGFERSERAKTKRKSKKYATYTEAMKNRDVTLASIYAISGKHSRENYLKIIDKALTLIPSIQRSSGKEYEENETSEMIWTTVIRKCDKTQSPLLKTRVTLDCVKPPPLKRRGSSRYVSAEKITRRFYYDLKPTRLFKEQEEDSTLVDVKRFVDLN